MAIFTGETVEDAIERGLNRLNVKRENVHIHIEQKEKKGFLGFGKKRARVNIEPIHEETVRKADHLAERGVDDTINLGVPKSQSAMEATLELSQVVKAVRAAEREQNGEITEEERNAIIEVAKKTVVQNRQGTADLSDVVSAVKEEVEAKKEVSNEDEKIASKISSYLTTITQEMGIATRVSVSRDGNLTVFNLTSNHTRMNIAVNVGDYHEKRKAYIVSLAHRAAERARGGETVYINDLQSNERKIVHTIIGQENGVSSHSEGQEYNRYIVVAKEI
ncbi:MAG: protein jag [Lactococcus lactis]|nr:protein jag [Lactococcus lactis]